MTDHLKKNPLRMKHWCGLLLTTALVAASFVITATTSSLAEEQAATPAGGVKKKQILFIAGAPSHANGEHEHRAGCMLLAEALNKSGLPVNAKVHWYGWPQDLSAFDGVDATIVYADAGGQMNQQIQQLIDTKVKQGMGIMFIHYGVHPTKEVGEKYYGPWTGAFFEDGWSVNPDWIADITMKKDHPVSRGVEEPFKVRDEFYFNMRKLHPKGDCDCCADLAVSTPTAEKFTQFHNLWTKDGEAAVGTPQALMWARDPGNGSGRGLGFVGGHYHQSWAIDHFRTMVLNAIVWCAGAEVPKGGVPSAKVTKEMLNLNLDRPEAGKSIELPTDELLKYKNPPPAFPKLK